MKSNYLKLGVLSLMMLAGTAMQAQQVTGDIATANKDVQTGVTKTVRVIDNKGTIKYLQASNGITTLTNTTNDVTTTTWQLGGTLIEDTNIATGANNFVIEVTPESAAGAGDAGTFQITGLEVLTDPTTAGLTVLIKEGNEVKEILLSDLLQVISGHEILATPAIGANTVTDMPADFSKVSVFRNGAKLVATLDYTVAAASLTLVDRSAAALAPADWTLFTGDVIEVHWIK